MAWCVTDRDETTSHPVLVMLEDPSRPAPTQNVTAASSVVNRAARIEPPKSKAKNLGVAVSAELQRHQREQHRLAGAGRSDLSLPRTTSDNIHDEVRRGPASRRWYRPVEQDEQAAHPYTGIDASGRCCNSGVGLEDLTQMGFAKDDDVIQAFSADRANQPLHMAILPG
jgi:hypothetical protein